MGFNVILRAFYLEKSNSDSNSTAMKIDQVGIYYNPL